MSLDKDNGLGQAKSRNARILGISLIVLSIPPWIAIFIVPFFPLSKITIGIICVTLLVVSEIMFWGGSLIVGVEMASKWQKFSNPLSWLWPKKSANKTNGPSFPMKDEPQENN